MAIYSILNYSYIDGPARVNPSQYFVVSRKKYDVMILLQTQAAFSR